MWEMALDGGQRGTAVATSCLQRLRAAPTGHRGRRSFGETFVKKRAPLIGGYSREGDFACSRGPSNGRERHFPDGLPRNESDISTIWKHFAFWSSY